MLSREGEGNGPVWELRTLEPEIIASRVYTSIGQRKRTSLSDGMKVWIPKGYAFVLIKNKQIVDYCDINGEWIYRDGETQIRARFAKEAIEQHLELRQSQLKESKLRPNETRAYLIKMQLLPKAFFMCEEPFTIRDQHYGEIDVRLYGGLQYKMQDPLQLLWGLIIDNEEVLSLKMVENCLDPSVLDLVMDEIRQCPSLDFMNVNSVWKQIRGHLMELINQKITIRYGIRLKNGCIYSLLPDASSREKMEE